MTIRSAETMLDKAIDLLAGAITLHEDGNDHAALLLAIHSGINSADAINEFYGERFSGEHRKAPDHLRRWDPERLSNAARWLRKLVDMKATVAYREKRFTARNTADAIATADRLHLIAHAQIESPIDIETRLRPDDHR
ncbi:MAG: hypothetical protein QGD91_12725 [Actinomycetota bacterium]|nr:hypothetical protein [Actinomycetota bacterium]